ncbi:MAG: hypothetical protein NWE89_05850 [Candidatus Bathyarchaeota archaeon]|nr:hypothetical protein [Candidatus Bathyarchaeota archaeon]
MQPFSAVLSQGRVVIPAQSEADSLHSDGYGHWVGNHILSLKPHETLYNVERQKIAVVDEDTNKRLSFQELLHVFTKNDSKVWTKFIVYRDLRTRGFITQGSEDDQVDFEVYERGTFRKNPPSINVIIISEGVPEPMSEVIKRLSKTEKKGQELKLAVVDRRGEIVYYSLSEKKFG